MQLAQRFRIPAVLCAVAVLVCALISRPYTPKGLFDDGPYILMAQHLAATGHFAYNGWASPLIGWQLYLGAAFVKLFGLSFTAVRMSTLLVAMVLAFALQRTIVRAGVNERNATIGTLAFVLSPMCLMLSASYMTDIPGLLALVLCLYGCLRAVEATADRAAIGWLCFAVVTNAIGGTARQIAWLGVLVMVPSTLWLLRANRRVLVAGASAYLGGVLFVFGCIQWLKHQPYIVPQELITHPFPLGAALAVIAYAYLDIPFLLLPMMLLFTPQLLKMGRRWMFVLVLILGGYVFLAMYPSHLRGQFPLEPIHGMFVTEFGIFEGNALHGQPPILLSVGVRVLLTIASFAGLVGLLVTLFRGLRTSVTFEVNANVSERQLAVLLGPFLLVSTGLLICITPTGMYDRYLMGLLVILEVWMVRWYQDRVRWRIPFAGVVLVAIMAMFGVALTHNLFALYRARVAILDELNAAGVPATSIDEGWEFNLGVELQHADHINNPRILVPADAYTPVPAPPAGSCKMVEYDSYRHIHPEYGVAFDPHACYGPAGFPPVQYSRWLASSPGMLYVVRYLPSSKE